MPLPRFQAGEVLSAVKLNQLVAVFNQTQNTMLSMGFPFEQVQINVTNSTSAYWSWMFRYNPAHPYYRLKYTWGARKAGSSASGGIKGTAGWTDPAGPTTSGSFTQDVNLSTLSLQPGKIYTYEIRADRTSSLDVNNFFRVDYLFLTSNPTYVPTIIG